MNPYRAVTGVLHFTSPLQISSGASNDLTDAPVRRDVQGRAFIPGPAVAGALRSLATRVAPHLDLPGKTVCGSLLPKTGESKAACGCVVCRLFGDLYQGDEAGDTVVQSHASRLWIYNANSTSEHQASQYRDGVGIERTSQASARQGAVKFDMEQLAAGAEFLLHIELDPGLKEESGEFRLFSAMLAEWQAGRGRLGARSSQGGGVFILKNLKYRSIDLRTGLMSFLVEDRPWNGSTQDWVPSLPSLRSLPEECENIPLVARSWAEIEFDLRFEGPFLNNDPVQAAALGVDHAPWMRMESQTDLGEAQPVLYGASLRGVLRSYSERIARTITTFHVKNAPDFLKKCPACDAVQSNPQAPIASCETLISEKKVITSEDEAQDDHLCLACQLFGSIRRASRLQVHDARLIGKPRWSFQDFLAIDRFTGGGLDGAKFDALALWKPLFHARIILENPQTWELGWLGLVLRDLNDGFLTFGFGAAKGYGRARGENWSLRLGYLTPDDLAAAALSTTGLSPVKDKAGLYDVLAYGPASTPFPPELMKAWAGKFVDVVKGYERTALPSLKQDAYFTNEMMLLYPKRGDL